MSGSTSTSAQQRLNAAVQLPQWVNQLVGNQNQLSENDLRKIEAAREFAAKLTAKFMQEASEKAAVSQQSIEASQPIAAVAPSVVRIYGMTEIQLNTRLYVGALHPGINEQHLRLAFSPYGPLKNISLTIDPTTMVHKGFCFVDFDTAEGASMAVERMNGVMLAGRPLKIGRPQGYTDEFIRSNPAPKTRLFVTNIHEIVTEDDLREMFGGFGVIKALAMPPDPLNSGKHKGYAYIEFDRPQAVTNALSCMDDLLVGDRCIKVSSCTLGGKIPEGMSSTQRGSAVPSHLQSIAQSITKQLESRTTATTATAAVASTAVTVLLQNMVGPEDVENDGSLLLLEEEIRQECQKFGRVERVQIVITKSDSVDIRVNFDGTDSAQSAVSQLNGRWFGGRQITATIIQ